MFKAVVFDFGGVVRGIGHTGSRQMIAELYGLPLDQIGASIQKLAYQMSVGKITEAEFWTLLSESVGKPKPGEWKKLWHERTTKDFKINIPIVELVKNLKSQKIQCFVLSNTIPPHVEFNRAQGWYEMFDKVYLSVDIGLRKPDIKAYEYVLKDQDLKGEECIYIDDLEENLVPARELGMKTILAVDPDQVVKDVMAALN
ncbi:MAG: HAD-superfamily hydrolase, subfamily IA, variant 3 [Microgenomates group bacterium Gr01-1014_16]|nr:MAG: HAD-superfamily hydrolase, subfamily IA, variant 3 [Microgenomates group bacterium Gr01-1014_16]